MEEALPALLARDLETGFERLVCTYQHRIYAFSLAMSGMPQEAEEVTQDAFIRAYRALSGYPPQRVRALQPSAWLHRIALNVYRNRRRGRRLQVIGFDEVVEPAAPEREGPAAVFERNQRANRLRAMLSGLPERHREAIVMRHVQGFSYDEAAALLRRPVGSVKSDVHRGLALLRAWLEQEEEVENDAAYR